MFGFEYKHECSFMSANKNPQFGNVWDAHVYMIGMLSDILVAV